MINLSIEEPKIEQFFNNSKEEVINALRFIVDNNIKYLNTNTSCELSHKQKEELDLRILSFHKDPTIGKSWSELKSKI